MSKAKRKSRNFSRTRDVGIRTKVSSSFDRVFGFRRVTTMCLPRRICPVLSDFFFSISNLLSFCGTI